MTTGVTINICPQSTSEYCEVFFNQGEVDGVQINSCADYCASYGLKCVHSYTINEYTQCYESQFMTEFPEGPYQYTTCEVPYDARYGIGCVCGKSKLQTYLNTNWIKNMFLKQIGNLILIFILTNDHSLGRMDQCCSTLKVRGEGPVAEYVEEHKLMQPFIFQYSGTTSGKPRYTMRFEGQKCDIVNTKEIYVARHGKYSEYMPHDFDVNSVSFRYGRENERNFWKVISFSYICRF